MGLRKLLQQQLNPLLQRLLLALGGGQAKGVAGGAVSYEKRPIYPPKDKGVAAGTWVTGVGIVALIAGGVALALLIGGGGGGGSDKSTGGSSSGGGSSSSSGGGTDDCGHGTMQDYDCQCDEGWQYDSDRKCTVPASCEGYSYESHTIQNCKESKTCWAGDVAKYGCWICDDGYKRNGSGGCESDASGACEGYPSSSVEMTGCKEIYACTLPGGMTKYKCVSCADDYDLVAGECQKKSPSECSGHGTKQGDTCVCDPGWTGDNCETEDAGECTSSTPVAHCQDDPCSNGKYKPTCSQCDSAQGWISDGQGGCQAKTCGEGFDSTTAISNCADAGCWSGGTHYYKNTCTTCASNYESDGSGGCQLVPTAECSGHGTKQGDTCVCNPGWTGEECDTCAQGYEGDNCVQKACTGYVENIPNCAVLNDADVCWSGSVKKYKRCTTCEEEYALNESGTCVLQDAITSLCKHGRWDLTNKVCVCQDGYTGTLCDTCDESNGYVLYQGFCVKPAEAYCSGHGTWDGENCNCDESNGYFRGPNYTCNLCAGRGTWDGTACVCEEGYVGNGCKNCDLGYVSSDGICHKVCGKHQVWNGEYCACDEGYTTGNDGACSACLSDYTLDLATGRCIKAMDTVSDCDPEGTKNILGEVCACKNGYWGTQCNRCAPGYKKNLGRCVLCDENDYSAGCYSDYQRQCQDVGGTYDLISESCSCGELGPNEIGYVAWTTQYDRAPCTACNGISITVGGGTACVEQNYCGDHGYFKVEGRGNDISICKCDYGWTGPRCNVCANGFVKDNNDNCVIPEEACGIHQIKQGDTCVCQEGYEGTDCTSCAEGYISTEGGCYAQLNCQNGTTQKGPVCDCSGTAYGGIHCDIPNRLVVQGQYPDITNAPLAQKDYEDTLGFASYAGHGYVDTDSIQNSKYGINWLRAIKAGSAYIRGYTGYMIDRDEDGFLKADGDDAYQKDGDGNRIPVKVGMIDSGFNVEFDANVTHESKPVSLSLKEHKSFDYGPCRNGDRTHCYAYDDGKMVFYGEGENDKTVILSARNKQGDPVTQELVDALFQGYGADYDWDAISSVPDSDGRHGALVSMIITGEAETPGLAGAVGENDEDKDYIGATRVQGVAPHSDLYAVNHYEQYKGNSNNGEYTGMFWFNEAMKYFDNKGVGVVNLSFGFGKDTFIDAIGRDAYEYYPTYYVEGFKTAAQNNTIVVQAAGNEGQTNPDLSAAIPLTSTFTKPDGSGSYLDNLYLTVVSVQKAGEGWTLANYSSACGLAGNYCIAAPGGTEDYPLVLHSTYTNATNAQEPDITAQGTSFATPMVTGAIALLQSAFPNLTSQQIVYLLLHTANNTTLGLTDKFVTGAGLLDLEKATRPYGGLGFSLNNISSNPDNLFVSNSGGAVVTSSIAVPQALRLSMMAVLPKTFTAFDALNRPYETPTSIFFKDTKNQKTRIFKKDFKAFRMQSMQGEVRTSDRLNFKFTNPVLGNNPSVPWGSLKMTYDVGDRFTIGFNYAEHTLYQTGDYFKKNLENPFFKMKETYGVEGNLRFGTKTNVSLQYLAGKNGFYVDEDDNDAYDNPMMGIEMKVMHKVTPKLTLGASVGMLDERHALLGMTGTDTFDPNRTRTYLGGLHLGYDLTPDLALGMAYYRGYTRTEGQTQVLGFTGIQSESLSFNMAYRLKKSQVGLDLTSPLRIRRGNALFDIPVGRHPTEDIVYRERYRASLKPAAREWDISAFYNRILSDSLNFQTKWGVRLNPEHQKGAKPDYFGLFNMNWMY